MVGLQNLASGGRGPPYKTVTEGKKMNNTSQAILQKINTLTPQQQQEVIDFIEFLESKNAKTEVNETPAISAYEAAKQWVGSVNSGLGDLSTNKNYMEGFGQ